MIHSEYLKAFADGKKVQILDTRVGDPSLWYDLLLGHPLSRFDNPAFRFRLAPVIKTHTIERWATVYVALTGDISEIFSLRESACLQTAKDLRERGFRVVADAVYMRQEVQYEE